ncbi:MAG: hypothetical protein U9N37_01220 [Thermodesulfobacteriota bacterium]|nr:hypothetical protein [Thermodesulfobacteriota bacterium]
MKKYKTITGILTYLCILSFGSGVGILLLYNHGDTFSKFIVFLTLFGTPFFISGIRNQINRDTFTQDLIIGVTAVFFAGLVLLLSSYEAMASVASIAIFIALILKLIRNRDLN